MKAKIFLRTAAVLVAVQSVLHTIGGVFGKPLPGAASAAYAAMKSNHFLVMGLDRSYWLFFIGFGLCITVSMVTEAAIFWLLGSLAPTMGSRLRPILAVFTVGYALLTVLAAAFFFPIPAIWNLVVVACLLAATVNLKVVRVEVVAPA
jgi:hypothetical protein